MALQVGKALACDRRQLRLLDGIQLTAPGPQLGEIVAARANMDADTLVPIGTIGAVPLGFGHDYASVLQWPIRKAAAARQPAAGVFRAGCEGLNAIGPSAPPCGAR